MKNRSHQAELLDGPVHDPRELAHSLGQVAQVNRWLAGNRALRTHLAPIFGSGGTVSLLDVGTGNGETLQETLGWAAKRGEQWTGVGVDVSPHTARLARLGGSTVVLGDALKLPFGDDTFDVVMCTLTLHHFDDSDAAALVAEMVRVARRQVLVNDLERTRANYLGARLLAATLWRGNRFTRNDGPLSVLRSFTAPELLAVGRAGGMRNPRVRGHFPWRLMLEGEP